MLRALAGLGALVAGGCGFRPLYGEAGRGGVDADIAAELAATRVGLVGERFGQLLRRGLQSRIEAASARPVPARWELLVVPSVSAQGVGVQGDGAVTRVRYIATANWTLLRLTPREPVANGFERAIEAYNVQPNQFFASDISRDAAERRLAALLAEEVVIRLSIRFRGMRDGVPTQLIDPVAPPPVLAEPPPGGTGGVPSPGMGGVGGGLNGGIGPLDTFR